MRPSSLGFRLALLSFFSIAVALVATTYALNARFQRYFEDRIYGELEQHLEQLTTSISLDEQGGIMVATLLDRRFGQPFSGLYWQVQQSGASDILSRSLWGRSFKTPDSTIPGQQFQALAKSPTGTAILVLGWPVLIGEGDSERTIVLSVAIDQNEVTVAAAGFRSYLIKWLGFMFVGLMIAAWIQNKIGLAPLHLIRNKVERVKSGKDTRLEGQYPSEVQPLVTEVNDLLELHEASLVLARARSSDLAHGLKTPLTVMRALAVELGTEGKADKAKEFEAQIESMHRFIERELAQPKTGQVKDHKTPVLPVVERMVSSMKKLPLGGALEWQVDLPAEMTIPFDAHDLSELFGNLLDNARKWARGKVIVRAVSDPDKTIILIEDDGPGVPDDLLKTVIVRGKSLDISDNSSGLGLAICSNLMASIDGNVALGRSGMGGLQVRISW